MPGQRFHKARITLRRCTTHGQPTNHQTGLTNTNGPPQPRLAAVAAPGIKGEVIAVGNGKIQENGDVRALDVPLPDPAGLAWESAAVPGALLYHYAAAREEPHIHYRDPLFVPARLTPFAYEAFGREFDYGVFEGTESPYDVDSPNFKAALDIWNGKRNQPHAYVQR